MDFYVRPPPTYYYIISFPIHHSINYIIQSQTEGRRRLGLGGEMAGKGSSGIIPLEQLQRCQWEQPQTGVSLKHIWGTIK